MISSDHQMRCSNGSKAQMPMPAEAPSSLRVRRDSSISSRRARSSAASRMLTMCEPSGIICRRPAYQRQVPSAAFSLTSDSNSSPGAEARTRSRMPGASSGWKNSRMWRPSASASVTPVTSVQAGFTSRIRPSPLTTYMTSRLFSNSHLTISVLSAARVALFRAIGLPRVRLTSR